MLFLAGREDASLKKARSKMDSYRIVAHHRDCLLARAWDHYRTFIGIINNGDDENELDDNGNEAFEGGGDNIKSSCVRL